MTSLTGDVHDLRFRARLGNPGSAEACPCRGCEEVLGVLDGSCADKCVVLKLFKYYTAPWKKCCKYDVASRYPTRQIPHPRDVHAVGVLAGPTLTIASVCGERSLGRE